MKVNYTPQDLIEFEEDICALFEDKKIRATIHLDSGNEKQLIHVFENYVDEEDWVLGSWRSQLKNLLKGVPPEELKQSIVDGKGISLCFPKYRTINSAIVAGILPVAVGIAMGIRRHGGSNKVVCWLGDMTSETGIFHECVKYATNWKLPVLWCIEDNGKSVCTITRDVWNQQRLTYEPEEYHDKEVVRVGKNILYYKYSSKYPHAGSNCGRINF